MRPPLAAAVFTLTAGLGLGLFARYQSPVSPPPAPGPRVQCPDAIDLGECVYGTDRDVTFEVRNTGTEDLILSGFRTSCTCTDLSVRSPGQNSADRVVVGPGEAVTLGARYFVRSRYNSSTSTRVGFATNDPAVPEVTVTVRAGRVRGGLTPLPGSCTFGHIPLGGKREQVVHLVDEAVAPRRVVSVMSSNPARVTARFAPGERPADLPNPGHYLGVVTVTLDATAPADIYERVTVTYDDGEARTEDIPVSATVTAKLAALPASVALPLRDETGEVYAANVWFRPGGRVTTGTFRLDLPPGVTAEVGEPGPGLIPVKLTVIPSADTAPKPLTVVARAEIDGEPIEARLTITVRPPAR